MIDRVTLSIRGRPSSLFFAAVCTADSVICYIHKYFTTCRYIPNLSKPMSNRLLFGCTWATFSFEHRIRQAFPHHRATVVLMVIPDITGQLKKIMLWESKQDATSTSEQSVTVLIAYPKSIPGSHENSCFKNFSDTLMLACRLYADFSFHCVSEIKAKRNFFFRNSSIPIFLLLSIVAEVVGRGSFRWKWYQLKPE